MKTANFQISQLEASPDNVRQSSTPTGLKELKASIAAHGLMQNLVVIEKGGKGIVVAGARRLTVLKELQKEGVIKKDYAVPCVVVEGTNANELSIAENIVREAMNPADEFEAFSELLKDKKMTIRDVAQRFGVDDERVEKRMRLGRVAPEIMKEFRTGKIGLRELEAFTVTDDHKKQISVLKGLKNWERHSHTIRDRLTDKMAVADSNEAKFIGRDAYKKAGGTIRADLFHKDQYFENGALLNKLVSEKVDLTIEKLKKDGWGFVEVSKDFDYDYNFTAKFDRLDKKPAAGNLKNSGVYLYLRDGKLEQIMLKKRGKESDKAIEGAEKKKVKKGISETLRADLAAYRQEIIQVAAAKLPFVAFDMMIFQVVEKLLRTDYSYGPETFAAVTFSKETPTQFVQNDKTKAKAAMKEHLAGLDMSWRKGTEADRFRAFANLAATKKSNFIAWAFAQTIKPRFPAKNGDVYEVAFEMLGVNIREFWTPNKNNYFDRITTTDLDKIGKELWKGAWKPKSANKSYLSTLLHDAFSAPEKASGNDKELLNRLKTWLPTGMGLNTSQRPSNEKEA